MQKKFDFVTLVASVIASLTWWLLGEFLYLRLMGVLPATVIIGLYFAGMSLFLAAACVVAAILRGHTLPVSKAFGKSAIILLVIALLGGVLQFVYSLDGAKTVKNHSSYIFLLDDSGSMAGNDPRNARADAVIEVMKTKAPDFPFAVYSFTSECRQLNPMTKADEAEHVQIPLNSDGQTNIANAIRVVLEDLETSELDGGDSPRIILLSDGADMSTSIDGVIERAVLDKVSVSTIGFGFADKQYLKHIAQGTDGVFVSIDDISEITEAVETAVVSKNTYKRTLIGLREMKKPGVLYGVMRTVFLVILGVGFFMIKSLLLRTNDKDSNPMLENALPILIGAMATELLINTLGISEFLARALLCVGFCLLLTSYIRGGGYAYGDVNSVGQKERYGDLGSIR